MRNLHELMDAFQQIEGARVGRGYRHPTASEPQLEELTEYFIEKYPFVKRDQGYLDFLRIYAGATIEQSDRWLVDVYGFYFDWMFFRFEDETTIDDHLNQEGYLHFCGSYFDGGELAKTVNGVGYYFHREKPGVYQSIVYWSEKPKERAYDWYCSDFLEWLDKFIEAKGITFPVPE